MSMDSFNLNILFDRNERAKSSLELKHFRTYCNWFDFGWNWAHFSLRRRQSRAGTARKIMRTNCYTVQAHTWIERWEIVEHKWMMKIHKTWNCEAAAFRFSADSRKKHKFLQFCNIGWQHTRRGKRAVKYFSHPTWHQYVIIWFKTWNLICFRFVGAAMLSLKCCGSVSTNECGTRSSYLRIYVH